MSTRYQKILIAIDGSEEADRVLEAATALDPKGGGRFDVVTVVPPVLEGVSGMGGNAFAAAWPLQDMEAAMRKEVTDGIRERVARFGIPPECVAVLYGRPASEIHAHAEELGADLIVVGSHGRGMVSRLMLGSTANAVLQGAKCDVLTVRIPD